MSITEVTIIHHVGIVLLLLWLLSSYGCCHQVFYFLSMIYLYLVHERYVMRLQRKLRFEERRDANKKRVLCDSETVRWLNHTVERMWPLCMEQIVSQKVLLPIMPWFLQKYKPWTAKEVMVQHLYLGRSPPMFTDMRVLSHSPDDDHLVLELGMNFLTADDMSAILAVKLRKRLGLGISTKLHILGMHLEGRVLVGVKFLRTWPFLGRLRVCFAEPPYFQMIAKPLFNHGIDVTEFPGIAGWLDKLLALALEQTLVKPNMLVVDLEKFVSPQAESWFSFDAKKPLACAVLEVIEATDMKPSDMNGLADPYVKGQLGSYKFKTKIQKKTLSPKWHEEIRIPIFTWEPTTMLTIEVRDKDHFVDDILGDYSLNLDDFRDGQRHDMWLSLRNIKTGRLHLAVTVFEGSEKTAVPVDGEILETENKENSYPNASLQQSSSSSELLENSPRVSDKLDAIDVEGQRETGIWVLRPGSEVAQIWESRKGKSRLLDSQILGERGNSVDIFKASVSGSYGDSSSADESFDGQKGRKENLVRRGLLKLGSIFRRSSKEEDRSTISEEPLSYSSADIKATDKNTCVKVTEEENLPVPSSDKVIKVERNESPKQMGPESPIEKQKMKNMARHFLHHAGKSASGIKKSVKRRVSKGKHGEPEVVKEQDVLVESDSSAEEESLTSPTAPPSLGGESVVSDPIIASDSSIDSAVRSEECTEEGAQNDTEVTIISPTTNKIENEDLVRTSAEQVGSLGENDALVSEFSKGDGKVNEA